MKDRFSGNSAAYAQFRPSYPAALYQHILQHVADRQNALDAGTGNGQAASFLSQFFEQVYATDISASQLEAATRKPNIHYSLQAAEQFNFSNAMFDLVVTAQAIHWFAFDEFFREVKRVLKPSGVFAMWGYGLVETAEPINSIIKNYYAQLHDYWDAERHHIEEHYASIPFPFNPLPSPAFSIDVAWNAQQLLGYLSTWSAAKNFIAANHTDPLTHVKQLLHEQWGTIDVRHLSFPVFMKMGKPQH